jgi:hypothetical protein
MYRYAITIILISNRINRPLFFINIKFGVNTFYTLNKNTKFFKVFKEYVRRSGMPKHSLLFVLDGYLINLDKDTPLTLKLVDYDCLNCMVDQSRRDSSDWIKVWSAIRKSKKEHAKRSTFTE